MKDKKILKVLDMVNNSCPTDCGYGYGDDVLCKPEHCVSCWISAINRKIEKDKIVEVREVKRVAKIGEYVKIVNTVIAVVPTTNGIKDYKVGDILEIKSIFDMNLPSYVENCKIKNDDGCWKILSDCEYVVLENYQP